MRIKKYWPELALFLLFVFWAVGLHDEATYGGFNPNDLSTHSVYTRIFLDAFRHRSLGFESWDNHCCLGAPVFRTYQNLGHMLAAATAWLFELTPSESLHWLLYLFLLLQPLAFYFAARRLALGRKAALFSAVLSFLSVSHGWMGNELGAYVTLGKGMFTQALGLPFFLATLAIGARFTGWAAGARPYSVRGAFAVGMSAALTFLFHELYGYLALLSLAVLALFGLFFRRAKIRLVPAVALAAAVFALVGGYQLLSVFQDHALMHETVWYPPARWNGVGAGEVLSALLRGDLFDDGRSAVLSSLVLFGAVISLARRSYRRAGGALLLMLGTGLIFMAGRASFVRLIALVPGAWAINPERFLGLVQVVGVWLAAIALAEIVRWAVALWRRNRIALAVLPALVPIAALGYLAADRLAFLEKNTQAIRDQSAANGGFPWMAVGEARALLQRGDIWAGIHGDALGPRVGRVPVYLAAAEAGYSELSCAEQNMNYPSDTLYLFEPSRASDYRVFNVQALLLPYQSPAPSFAKRLFGDRDFVIYQTPGRGAWDVVSVNGVAIPESGRDYVHAVKRWLESAGPAQGSFPAIVPRAVASRWPQAVPRPSSAPVNSSPGSVAEQTPIADGRSRAVLLANGEGAYGIVRTAYHPHWQVQVNGRPATPRWLAPGYLAFSLEPGRNVVEIAFPADPWRSALFAIGAGMVMMAFVRMAWLFCLAWAPPVFDLLRQAAAIGKRLRPVTTDHATRR